MKLLPKIGLSYLLVLLPWAALLVLPKEATIILIILIASLILATLSSLYFFKNTTANLQSVLRALAELSTGRFNNLNIKSSDEIGEIAAEFNEMGFRVQTKLQTTQSDGSNLLSERNKLEVVLTAISDGVIALDLNHNITIFNPSAERILGYTKESVLGKPFSQLVQVFDQGKALPLDQYCQVKPGFEGVILSKQGLEVRAQKQAVINLIISQLANSPTVNIGCIITMQDITKDKDLERMKLDFVSMAAHELRTPLTSIRGYLDVIYKESPPQGEYFQFLEKAIIGTNELFALITNLLDVSRIERGAMSPNFLPVDLETVAKRVVENMLTTSSNKQIELHFTPSQTPIPKIHGDQLKLEEVISNLVANAINYTNPGGKITVWLETDGSLVTTHVKDNGKGIPAEAIPHLFTKFFRVVNALEAQGSKGTGLGLYISKSIIDLHHGKIWVESELGKGSTFSFSIPISK